MKRSSKIALSIIATVTLTSCGGSSTRDTRRELYSSIEDCTDDWGSSDRCEPHPRGSGYYGPHYIYSGGRPLFFPTGSSTPQPLENGGKFSQLSEGAHSPRSAGTSMAKFDTSARALAAGSNYHSSSFRSAASSSAHGSVSRGGFGHAGSAHGSGS